MADWKRIGGAFCLDKIGGWKLDCFYAGNGWIDSNVLCISIVFEYLSFEQRALCALTDCKIYQIGLSPLLFFIRSLVELCVFTFCDIALFDHVLPLHHRFALFLLSLSSVHRVQGMMGWGL